MNQIANLITTMVHGMPSRKAKYYLFMCRTPFLWCIVLVVLIRLFVGEIYKVNTTSMEPTIQPVEILFVEKISEGALLPRRFSDIPLLNAITKFKFVKKLDCRIDWGIHRMPGFEKVKPGDIVLFYAPDGSGNILVKRIQHEVTDHSRRWFYMIGDNMENSSDSRSFGFVSEHLVIGRICFVLFSARLHSGSMAGIRWHRIGCIPQ